MATALGKPAGQRNWDMPTCHDRRQTALQQVGWSPWTMYLRHLRLESIRWFCEFCEFCEFCDVAKFLSLRTPWHGMTRGSSNMNCFDMTGRSQEWFTCSTASNGENRECRLQAGWPQGGSTYLPSNSDRRRGYSLQLVLSTQQKAFGF
jgi:hypothetical protein